MRKEVEERSLDLYVCGFFIVKLIKLDFVCI